MLAHRVISDGFLPRGPRFEVLKEFEAASPDGVLWAFGSMGVQDHAKFLASLYIDDLADVIRASIDKDFELARYAEKISASAPSFDPLLNRLEGDPTLVDRMLDELTLDFYNETQPDVVGFSVPFPGNLYGALRMARVFKKLNPSIQVVFGGGYINTELRTLQDVRVFDFVDYMTFDDGERPLLAVLDRIKNSTTQSPLLRTMVKESGHVKWITDSQLHDIPFKECGPPTYEGLPLDRYLSMCELLNPMHRLWTDGRWNKLVLAHGCYWKKCTFCDVSLDYIGRYEPESVDRIIGHIEKVIAETGQTGFHFVDEAAPPSLLKALAEKLIEKNLQITWWGNIRFEKSFDLSLTSLLARSGCIAVSGGIEVASNRLLSLMEKGVTVEQVAKVTHAFSESGIMVHAYLMYGFPSETVQETIDSLERVRQLFESGCIQSAYWHRFSATVHSPVGKNPDRYGIQLQPISSTFASNDIPFVDSTGVEHEKLEKGLQKAVYNYMLGIGIENDVRTWFDTQMSKPKVKRNLISEAIEIRGC